MISSISHRRKSHDLWEPGDGDGDAEGLTAEVQVDGVASLPVGVLEAAVEAVVAERALGEDEARPLQPVLGLHVRPVHLPGHRGVVVQGAALHGDVPAHPLVLVPSHCGGDGKEVRTGEGPQKHKKKRRAEKSREEQELNSPPVPERTTDTWVSSFREAGKTVTPPHTHTLPTPRRRIRGHLWG